MKQIILSLLIIIILVSCSHSDEGKFKETQAPPTLTTTAQQDSTKPPQEPEGFKSPHQEHSEQHKGEPSKIK
ncbi:hypothetical protein IIC38_12265 [candidate division KSB1 bacterium]|nr:hypothetical protein [candidate division KSB1 bacterium]